jgi:transcription termination factor Rho
MTKSELEKKPLSDLHLLAAEAGVEKYRMLTKPELVERLAGEDAAGAGAQATDGGERPRRQDRPRQDRPRQGDRPRRRRPSEQRQPRERPEKAPEREPAPAPVVEAVEPVAATPEPSAPSAAERSRPRRRRRRRFGRRGKQSVTLQTLLLPPEAGRQALVFAETREGCTTLLRGVAADLSADANGPDPVALLIDPSPEELADWKRDAPQAEIVSAGQPRHAGDALAQAASRAGRGEDVILLVDSLTRLAEATEDAEAAKQFFDAGRTQGNQGGGSLTVVAALERPS